ncbi:hypothetical protein JKA74_11075 [Marivirga sp. S37H4]|uniref:Sulfotransferase domain-containing protein n=1 Tax=Marivirga aurantiaca TaxID=2802615 RepID=A0A934WZE7_9BACT|nr:hypothetical protein [Marivirga aurantiaca]MBK6265580.1 hypothetical protein [Marivirga aurantiaca]
MNSKKVETVPTNDIVNKNELRVVGMSRSGNHAIINWIIQQLNGRYCFLNCAEPKTNPFYTARPLHQEATYRANYNGFDLEAEKVRNFSKKDYLIHSYEDCFLSMLNHKTFEEQHDAFVGPSENRLDILILRDPFNLFASRIRSGLYKEKKPGAQVTPLTARRIWKQHAREALGLKRHLQQKKIVINYNLWVFDPEYRQNIAIQLGLAFTDNGFHEVSDVAGGSSFDGLKFENRAGNMKVLDRWKHYVDDPAYKMIFDDELIDLSHQVFGHIPDERLLAG